VASGNIAGLFEESISGLQKDLQKVAGESGESVQQHREVFTEKERVTTRRTEEKVRAREWELRREKEML
jgi:hypothetical protein